MHYEFMFSFLLFLIGYELYLYFDACLVLSIELYDIMIRMRMS